MGERGRIYTFLCLFLNYPFRDNTGVMPIKAQSVIFIYEHGLGDRPGMHHRNIGGSGGGCQRHPYLPPGFRVMASSLDGGAG